MDSNSVPADVRWAIANWPDEAARGDVSRFCERHQITRAVFYKIRKVAVRDGAVAALEPASRRPKSSPQRTGQSVIDQALAMRTWLIGNGLDAGPLSVADRMRRTGLTPPSRATLARVFAAAGVSATEPGKKPRAALRRFVYPAPNCCWQLDAFAWSLADGSPAAIHQLIDDHSRLDVGSIAARGETAHAAVRCVSGAIREFGAPQKLLSDNGVAFNPTRRGFTGQLVGYLVGLGVEPITGKPGRPTTQGKNERSHQPLQKWLNARPPAATIEELQVLVDQWRHVYNHERGHQGLGMKTPWEAWQATPRAPEPTPAVRMPPVPTAAARADASPGTTPPRGRSRARAHPLAGDKQVRVKANGQVKTLGCLFYVATNRTGHTMRVVWDATTVTFVDTDGVIVADYPRPATTGLYVGPRNRSGTPLTGQPRRPSTGTSGSITRAVAAGGYVAAIASKFYVGESQAGHTVTVTWNDTEVVITDTTGDELRRYPTPTQSGRWHGPRDQTTSTMS